MDPKRGIAVALIGLLAPLLIHSWPLFRAETAFRAGDSGRGSTLAAIQTGDSGRAAGGIAVAEKGDNGRAKTPETEAQRGFGATPKELFLILLFQKKALALNFRAMGPAYPPTSM